jgi:hypothetical protein
LTSATDLTVTQARAVVAGLRSQHPADDPRVVEAQRNLEIAKLARQIRQTMAERGETYPPLTAQQRVDLAGLFLIDYPAAAA